MSSKDLRDNIANTAKSGFGKAKEISGKVSDKAKSTVQTQSERISDNQHFKNIQEHVSPHFRKIQRQYRCSKWQTLRRKFGGIYRCFQ